MELVKLGLSLSVKIGCNSSHSGSVVQKRESIVSDSGSVVQKRESIQITREYFSGLLEIRRLISN
jgi:hypothetical protein